MSRLTEKQNSVTCALIGHSKVVSVFWGYVHCARCGDQIGDTLGGMYSAVNNVVVGHNCPTCRENWKKLTWKDKLFIENPFVKEEP